MIPLAINFVALPLTDLMLIGAVMVVTTATHRLGMWPYSLVAFPGTVAHELGHYLCAMLCFARPNFPSLIPVREGRGWTLGSVEFVPTIVNVIPIALAPLLLLPVGMWYAVDVMSAASGWWYLAHGWIVGTLFLACLPSRTDWAVAAPALLLLLLVTLGYWWWRA